MPDSRTAQAAAVVLATLLGAATFLALTEGLESLRASEAVSTSGPGHVPEFVYDAPDTVPTTADYGPVGPVSVVFAGAEVLTGLTGSMVNPWIAVSSRTGEYRALSAPHRPEPSPDAVAVSPDGTVLAWGYADGVVVYDPVTDRARELAGVVDADPRVGPFSPDGRLLTVYDGELRVLRVDTGEVVATLSGVDQAAARQAVWSPDGSALTYARDGRLVTHDWRTDDRAEVRSPTPIARDATLAWQPAGDRLAVMRELRGVRFVEVLGVADDGGLTVAGTVEADGYAQQELLGFTGEARVTVTALTLETATLPLVFNMSTEDAFPPTRVMQLPGSGRVVDTLQVAARPLAAGSADFEEPDWPASDRAKLVASIVFAGFLLGLYLTRRPRAKATARRQSRRGGR